MKRLLQRLMGGPTCDEVLVILQAYLDGEVDADTAAKVAQHIERCSDCTVEAETYQLIVEQIQQRTRPVDPKVIEALEQFGHQLLDERS